MKKGTPQIFVRTGRASQATILSLVEAGIINPMSELELKIALQEPVQGPDGRYYSFDVRKEFVVEALEAAVAEFRGVTVGQPPGLETVAVDSTAAVNAKLAASAAS